jgi:2-hydroxychromene-2-carboxylate isomerase
MEVVKHDPGSQPAFYYDLASPESYLAAERAIQELPGAEWIPILGGASDGGTPRAQIESTAAARGLQPLRWPDPFPFDSSFAMRVATYAKQIGRAVAFSLAAFRQAFAGGRDLSQPDNVLIAASACEMHPAAVLKGAELRTVVRALDAATALAAQRGVRGVPAVWLADGSVFHGDDELDLAARALRG